MKVNDPKVHRQQMAAAVVIELQRIDAQVAERLAEVDRLRHDSAHLRDWLARQPRASPSPSPSRTGGPRSLMDSPTYRRRIASLARAG